MVPLLDIPVVIKSKPFLGICVGMQLLADFGLENGKYEGLGWINGKVKLLENKISNIGKTNPQFIATGNIGCITQIANGTKIPILHTVEIIDWYTGGPKPEVLKKL